MQAARGKGGRPNGCMQIRARGEGVLALLVHALWPPIRIEMPKKGPFLVIVGSEF